MAAGVVADVDHQPVPLALHQVVPVEVREAGGPHVGHMDIAEAARRALVHMGPAREHEVPISYCAVALQHAHGPSPTLLARRFHLQLRLRSPQVGKGGGGGAVAVDGQVADPVEHRARG